MVKAGALCLVVVGILITLSNLASSGFFGSTIGYQEIIVIAGLAVAAALIHQGKKRGTI